MKKLLFISGFCLTLSLLAQQPPAKVAAPAPKGATVKPGAKVEEKKEALDNVEYFFEGCKSAYKKSIPAVTALKLQAVKTYNDVTDSHYFQAGKITLGAILLYYGVQEMKNFAGLSLPRKANTTEEVEEMMGELRLLTRAALTQVNSQEQIYNFLKNRKQFMLWLRDPQTKGGIKVLAGGLLMSKQTSELYHRIVKRVL